LLPKNIQIKIYTAIILPLVLYWHETWPFVEGGTQAEGVGEECAEEGIQAYEEMGNR